MERRTFMAMLAGGIVVAPLAAEAQRAGKVYRIGVLSSTGPEQENFIWADLRGLLRERGWIEGQNLVLDWRYAEAKYERLPDLAAELVRLKPDLIMARGGPGATAAKRATATIPIVMYNATNPVGIGLVQSLARPGGNVTGLTDDQGPEIIGKQLQLLKEVAPTVSKWRASRESLRLFQFPLTTADMRKPRSPERKRWGCKSGNGTCWELTTSTRPSQRSSGRASAGSW